MKIITIALGIALSILALSLQAQDDAPVSPQKSLDPTPTLQFEVYNPKDKTWSKATLDRAPEPVGGEQNFWNIVSHYLIYPDKAQRAKLEGDVIITMTINQKGELAGLALKSGLGLGCEEESFRALQIAAQNRFVPALKDGKAVAVRYDVSIGFYMKG